MKRFLLAVSLLLLLGLCLCAGALAEGPFTTHCGAVIDCVFPTLNASDVGAEIISTVPESVTVEVDGEELELHGTKLTMRIYRDKVDWLAPELKEWDYEWGPSFTPPEGYGCIGNAQMDDTEYFGDSIAAFADQPNALFQEEATMHGFPCLPMMGLDSSRGLFIPYNQDGYAVVRWYSAENDAHILDEYIHIIMEFDNADPFLMDVYRTPKSRVRMNAENVALIESDYADGCVTYTYDVSDIPAMQEALANPPQPIKTRVYAPDGAEKCDDHNPLLEDGAGKYIELSTWYTEAPGNTVQAERCWIQEIGLTWKDSGDAVVRRELLRYGTNITGRTLTVDDPVFADWQPVGEDEMVIVNPLSEAGVKCSYKDKKLTYDLSGAKGGYELSQEIVRRIKKPAGAAYCKWLEGNRYSDRDMTVTSIEYVESQMPFYGENESLEGDYWTYKEAPFEKVDLPDNALTIYFGREGDGYTTYVIWYDENDEIVQRNYFQFDVKGASVKKTTESVEEADLTGPVTEPVVIGKSGWKLVISLCPTSGGHGAYYELKLINPKGDIVSSLKTAVTVYLPYPAGIDFSASANYTFTLNHYNYNHTRSATVTLTPTLFGLRFETDSFSPFVVEYEKVSEPYAPPAEPAPGAANNSNPEPFYPGENAPALPPIPNMPGSYYAPTGAACPLTIPAGGEPITRLTLNKSQKLSLLLAGPGAKASGAVWTSSDKSVFTVNKKGKLAAKKIGKAYLIGTDALGRYGMALIEVVAKGAAPKSVSLAPKKLSVAPGELALLTAKLKPAGALGKLYWHSENPEIATVVNGQIKAVSAGETKILVRTENGLSAKATVVVAAKTGPTSLTLKKTARVKAGRSIALKPMVKPKSEKGAILIWDSGDETVAAVDQLGNVTGIKAGVTTITARCANGLMASCLVTVEDNPLKKIVLPKKKKLSVNEVFQLTATLKPADAKNVELIWTSDNPAVATVVNGLVTAVSPGKAKISAASGGKSAVCAVSVK